LSRKPSTGKFIGQGTLLAELEKQKWQITKLIKQNVESSDSIGC